MSTRKDAQKVSSEVQEAATGLTGGRDITDPPGTAYPPAQKVSDLFFDRFNDGDGSVVDPHRFKTVRAPEVIQDGDGIAFEEDPEEEIPEALRLLTDQKPGVYEVGGTTVTFPGNRNGGSWDSWF